MNLEISKIICTIEKKKKQENLTRFKDVFNLSENHLCTPNVVILV